jgi:hypothetical protein
MMTKNNFIFLIVLLTQSVFSQVLEETNPPFHIKTISFVQNGQNVVPLFKLGDTFQLQFDDLHGDEEDYFYQISHCDYNWQPSQLTRNEYLGGFDDQRIIDYENSLNALQIYSHYRISFPNRFTQLKVSGNYIITILNDDRDVVFSRKFIVYEELVSVPLQVKSARDLKDVNKKHNLDFAVKSNSITFQSPLQNVKVLLMQNGRFDNAITNIKPMYTIGNDLIYKYDKETQFWAGNEYLFFENKNIRAANNSIARIDTNGGLYNCHLYANNPRAEKPYTFWPDLNGNFSVNCLNAQNFEIECDYAWIYFTLTAPSSLANKNIYITGMFNNFALTEENKMEYNPKKGIFEKAMMIKQGFTNYKYVVTDKSDQIDEANSLDGNYFQTENNYFAIIYYRENNQRYDRVIGKGVANSIDMVN